MRKIWNGLTEFYRRGDLLLLFLCVLTTVFGMVVIASATNYSGSSRFLIVQGAALVLGILLYIAVSSLDVEILAEHRQMLMVFNTGLMSMLLVWGVEGNTGNRAWLDLPLLPVNIQPAEICKITFVICLGGIRLGEVFGTRLSGKASILGGVILIAIGLEIFLTGTVFR